MQYFDSLMEAFDWLKKEGFAEDFYLKNNGLWHSKSEHFFPANEVSIVRTIKLESDSDPDYTSFVFAVEIKGSALKGYFVDASGSYAVMEFSDLKEMK